MPAMRAVDRFAESGPARRAAGESSGEERYAFGNPAGCASVDPGELTGQDMLANTQKYLGTAIDLAGRRMTYIWNGPENTMMDVTDDPYVFEFSVNAFQPPYTYQADSLATVLLNYGFVVWFRSYGGHFRLTAIPMVAGVEKSAWAQYVTAYWQAAGLPTGDKYVQPVTRKLPCHWIIDRGWVTDATLRTMFDFNWSLPDYLAAGRKFLAGTCRDAYRISQQQIGYWDATSMCGPLTWRTIRDANGFSYRVGNWYSNARLFTDANPRWNGRPWLGFDPATYDIMRTSKPMAGYDFATFGELEPGDIVYSFSTPYRMRDGRFDHIFLVAGVDADGSRKSITNMVQNAPFADCSIREVTLYTSGDRGQGVINHEWNDGGYGRTGTTGFEVLRWKWATYHLQGRPISYIVREGDTLETIAFDWKVSPQGIADANGFGPNVQLEPGQAIILPVPAPLH